ncbi:MAG: carboxypeptidase-like regulatory domain-containing protein [Acidobacteriota bacterium]
MRYFKSDPGVTRKRPRAIHVVLVFSFMAALVFANALVKPRTTDVVKTAVSISADKTINFDLPNGYLVSGNVKNSAGNPVRGAVIQATCSDGNPSQRTITNSSGGFQLAVRSGTHRVDIWPPPTNSIDPTTYPKLVPASAGTYDVTRDTSIGSVTLPDGNIVSGELKAASGNLWYVAGFIFAIPAGGGYTGPPIMATQGADPNTTKYAAALPAGKFTILATGIQGFSRESDHVDAAWDLLPCTSFYARRVNITKSMALNLKLPSGGMLSGSVRDTTGQPLHGYLFIQKQNGNPMKDGQMTFMPVANGSFIGHLPAGRFDATFVPEMPASYKGRATKTHVALAMTSVDKTLNIVAENGVVLTGRIAAVGGAAFKASSAIFTLSGATPGSADALPLGAKSDDAGKYRLCVPPGTYDIQALPSGFGFLSYLERLAKRAG